MKGVNKAIIVGTLGQDPDTRYTGSGAAITNISLATNETWTDKQSGEKQERTEWHRVTFFGKLAEIAGEYLKKGRQVYVEGSLRTEKYTDKDGVERYTTKIIADQMQMLGGQGGGDSPAPRQQRQGNAPRQTPPDSSYGDRAQGGFDDDDIPFRSFRPHSYY